MQPTQHTTVIGVFTSLPSAQSAISTLTQHGFDRESIKVQASDERIRSGHEEGGLTGFFKNLLGSNDDKDERIYTDAVRHGRTVVCVDTDAAHQDEAAEILDKAGATDVEEQAAGWRADEAPGMNNQTDSLRGEDRINRSIPVVEEELRVGKRVVQRGGVRIYTHATEQPVEEEVRLREEQVNVDRRPADRPATEADLRLQDDVIEVTAMAEEPVVEKRARVIEEVVVNKESTERTERVRDTVRRNDVTVEPLQQSRTESADYDNDFRTDFQTRYGSNTGAMYENYAPAYQYGYQQASDQRYRGRSWDEVESDLRSNYSRTNPKSTWEEVKDAVRYGWYKVSGR